LAVVERPACLYQPNQNRRRLPIAARIHLGGEAADFGGKFRVRAAQILQNLVARKINAVQIIFLGDHRRKPVAFEHQPENRDAMRCRPGHSIRSSSISAPA
jgi:hypothetical protein